MTDTPAAFQATVHGFRTIPSRGVVSITIEAPLERHAEIARIAEHGAWVAVARLQQPKEEAPAQMTPARPRPAPDTPTPGGEKRRSPAQMAGILSNDPVFGRFLLERHNYPAVNAADAAAYIRDYCGVPSRKDILPGTEAERTFEDLRGRFIAWKAVG